MREGLVRSDMLECVIGLGKNLFYNSPMEACIIICRMNKKPTRRGQVLFINAVGEVERKNAQSYLDDKHIRKIACSYENYETDEEIAQLVTIKDIEENDFSLSIPLYVKSRKKVEAEDRSMQECYECWHAASNKMKHNSELLNDLINKGADKRE